MSIYSRSRSVAAAGMQWQPCIGGDLVSKTKPPDGSGSALRTGELLFRFRMGRERLVSVQFFPRGFHEFESLA